MIITAKLASNYYHCLALPLRKLLGLLEKLKLNGTDTHTSLDLRVMKPWAFIYLNHDLMFR